MKSFVEFGAMLTPKPVAWLFMQSEPVTGTAVHVIAGAVIGSPGGTSTLGPPGVEPPEPPEPPVPGVEPPVPGAPPAPGPVVGEVVVDPASPPEPDADPPVPVLVGPAGPGFGDWLDSDDPHACVRAKTRTAAAPRAAIEKHPFMVHPRGWGHRA